MRLDDCGGYGFCHVCTASANNVQQQFFRFSVLITQRDVKGYLCVYETKGEDGKPILLCIK